MDWYKRYIGDYRKKTGRLSPLEHGIYNLLLDELYASEEPLPADMLEIYRFLRAITPEEQEAADKIIEKFWRLTEGGFINERGAEEIEKRHAQGKINQRIALDREAAKRGESTNRSENEHEPYHETATYTRVQSPESNTGNNVKQPALPPGLTARVFAFWQSTLGHPRAKLSDKRRRRIAQAFRAGFTEDDIKQAIEGCSKTPFNTGHNAAAQVYDDLELILRDTEHIERFIGNAVPPGEKTNPEAEARYQRVLQRSVERAQAEADAMGFTDRPAAEQ